MDRFATNLKVPDLWQQEAVRHLNDGQDVVVNAPTGAGKTYIFELFVQQGLRKPVVFTVPTRALANDKLAEWRARGWNVGIATGDIAENLDAPVVVATLETQKSKFLHGIGPGLLVIDEYQMLADNHRGINYELGIALAPPGTQLLLLSGSVANPERIVQWLRLIGRDAELVDHRKRPVPLNEINIEALPDETPPGVRGTWPRWVHRILEANLGPLLIFAPQRRSAEEIATKIAQALPIPDWLELTAAQRALTGDSLARILRQRVAFHHSGLNYPVRAGLIEPLAKAGQLRVIVATTGLAAGINFSMRSVLISEREYQHGGKSYLVRPDELLQMFGRAGRRGLDDRGFVIVTPGRPRLTEARPIHLKRSSKIDWPSFIAVMHTAVNAGTDPVSAAEQLASRLFSEETMALGLRRLKARQDNVQPPPPASQPRQRTLREMLALSGEWERQKPPTKSPLGDTFAYLDGRWVPALQTPKTLEKLAVGTLCRLPGDNGSKRYGRVVPLATMPTQEGKSRVSLVKWFHRALRQYYSEHRPENRPPPKYSSLRGLTEDLVPLLPHLTQGGKAVSIDESSGTIVARLDYADAVVFARRDSRGNALLNPPVREVEHTDIPSFAFLAGEADSVRRTPAENWLTLGLIDQRKQPTRRGVLFSFFNHGEGLAIAAAIEDESYPLEDLLFDIANLRAGHRFNEIESNPARLGSLCRLTYRGLTAEGYLNQGIPQGYGEAASEVLAAIRENPAARNKYISPQLGSGDIERAALEWRSLLNHIAFAPDYPCERWMEFKELARVYISTHFQFQRQPELPELTPAQLRHRTPQHLETAD